MLFTFANLHPRKQADDALRKNKERFERAFKTAPASMAIAALDGWRMLDVNDAFTAATGWRREEVVGRGEPDLEFCGFARMREQLQRQIHQTGYIYGAEIQLRGKHGGIGHYLLPADTVMIQQDHCVSSVMLDITERKRTEM